MNIADKMTIFDKIWHWLEYRWLRVLWHLNLETSDQRSTMACWITRNVRDNDVFYYFWDMDSQAKSAGWANIDGWWIDGGIKVIKK